MIKQFFAAADLFATKIINDFNTNHQRSQQNKHVFVKSTNLRK
jgi:hypothetical protein